MTYEFDGSLRLPADGGPGLAAHVTVDGGAIAITAGDDHLGAWSAERVFVQRDLNGAFLLTLGGEDLYFTPDSPSDFATAVTVPLQPKRAEERRLEPEPDRVEAPAVATADPSPLHSLDDHDDMLTAPMLTGIVTVAVLVMAAAIGVLALV